MLPSYILKLRDFNYKSCRISSSLLRDFQSLPKRDFELRSLFASVIFQFTMSSENFLHVPNWSIIIFIWCAVLLVKGWRDPFPNRLILHSMSRRQIANCCCRKYRSISLNCSSVEAKRKPVAHIPRSTPASRVSSFAWKTHKYDVLRAINRMPKCLHSQGA